jgi:hypothetical protein
MSTRTTQSYAVVHESASKVHAMPLSVCQWHVIRLNTNYML